MLREAGGSVKLVEVRPHTDGKVFALGAPLEPDGERREEREEHKRIQLLNQKDGFKEMSGSDLYWKSRPVFSTSNMELKFELSQ